MTDSLREAIAQVAQVHDVDTREACLALADAVMELMEETMTDNETVIINNTVTELEAIREANLTPRLGLATNEEMIRELICRCRFSLGRVTTERDIDRALALAEILGGMDVQTREYRTVGYD